MSDTRERARAYRERVRDNYVLRMVGAGLATMAEYDEPAIMAAFAESEAALARKQERLECAKAACYYCRTERFYETAQRTKPGYWNHVAKTEGDPDVPCRVAPIHERNLAETGA